MHDSQKHTEAFMPGSRLLLVAAAMTSLGATHTLAYDPLPVSIPVSIDFAQQYARIACPSSAPATAFCLGVTGTANSAVLGAVSFERTVVVPNIGLFDPDHPTCIPDETSGTLTLPNGALTFRAPGNVCLADGTASYGLIVTGGSGTFKGVLGGGQITVPPPDTASTGRELWRVDLFPASASK